MVFCELQDFVVGELLKFTMVYKSTAYVEVSSNDALNWMPVDGGETQQMVDKLSSVQKSKSTYYLSVGMVLDVLNYRANILKVSIQDKQVEVLGVIPAPGATRLSRNSSAWTQWGMMAKKRGVTDALCNRGAPPTRKGE